MSREHDDVLTPGRPRKPILPGRGTATDLLDPESLFYNTFSAQDTEVLFLKAAKFFPAPPHTQESHWTRAGPPGAALAWLFTVVLIPKTHCTDLRHLLSQEGPGKMSQLQRSPTPPSGPHSREERRATGKSYAREGGLLAPHWDCLGRKGACLSPSLQGGLQVLQELALREAPRRGRFG